jgi:hypothetical protein
MTFSTDWRALCAELVNDLHDYKVANEQYEDALVNRARARLAEPEPQGPTAWMYLGDPCYDGDRWHDQWEVTLDEKVARYKAGNKKLVPLWCRPAIAAELRDTTTP